ncbi:MAG: ABC transporter permease [Candidatus Thorarchaeota archaeon]
MSTELIQEQLDLDQIITEKQTIGLKRYITQITDTINFEFKRTWKTFLIMLIVYLSIFLLNLLIYELEVAAGVELPEEPIDYIEGYFGFFGILIIISTATFGGGIIAEDFQKQTGNLLFPKISKSRLLIGRIISRYSLNSILIVFYYIIIGIITNYKYGEIPDTYINSMSWALLYTFMVFTFVIFMSSINKSKSAAIIISILLFLIAFNIIESILMVTKTGIEPLFIPTYYENIIEASLDMPDPRFEEVSFGSPREDNPAFKRWLTPSISGALSGMLLFSAVQLTIAYLFYKRRQSKNE